MIESLWGKLLSQSFLNLINIKDLNTYTACPVDNWKKRIKTRQNADDHKLRQVIIRLSITTAINKTLLCKHNRYEINMFLTDDKTTQRFCKLKADSKYSFPS